MIRSRHTQIADCGNTSPGAALCDHREFIESWGGPIAEAKLITSLPVPLRARQTWRVTYTDGVRVKLRILDDEVAVERRERVARALPAGDFARFLGCRGRAMLEEWVEGRPLAELQRSESVLRSCGEIMGRLHRTPFRHHGPFGESPAHGRWWVKVVRKNGLQLVAAGLLTARELEEVCEAAEAACPEHLAVGLVHGDICPENAVLATTGRPVIVDNETVKEGPLGYDIARSWRRWSLEADDERILLEGYARHADPDEYARSAAFWRLFVTVEALAYRANTGAEIEASEVKHLVEPLARANAVRPTEAAGTRASPVSRSPDGVASTTRFAHDSCVVELSGLSSSHVDWVADFLFPVFVRSGRGADISVRLHPAPEAGRWEPTKTPDAMRTQLFIVDGSPGRALSWRSDDGTRGIHDEESRTSITMGPGPEIALSVGDGSEDLRLALLRLLRDLATWRALARGAVLLHASAVSIDGAVVAMAGRKGSGKTTLLLQACQRDGVRIVANDRLLVGADLPARTIGIPTIVKLLRGTVDLFPALADEIKTHRLNFLDAPREAQHRSAARVASHRGNFNLSPGQLCQAMAVGRGAAGWLSTVIFPEIDPSVEREGLLELDRAAGLQRLRRDGLFPLAMPPGPVAEFAGFDGAGTHASMAELDRAVGGACFFAWRSRPGRHDRAFADALDAVL